MWLMGVIYSIITFRVCKGIAIRQGEYEILLYHFGLLWYCML